MLTSDKCYLTTNQISLSYFAYSYKRSLTFWHALGNLIFIDLCWLSFNYFMKVNYLASFQERFTPTCKLITGDLSLYHRHFLIFAAVCQHLWFIQFRSDSFEQVRQFILFSLLKRGSRVASRRRILTYFLAKL